MAHIVPGLLKKALDLLEADSARAWTVGEIASACGVGRRTLQRQFRRFIGRMPMEFLRDLRLNKARPGAAPGIKPRKGHRHRCALWFQSRWALRSALS